MGAGEGNTSPDSAAIRAARANIRYHLQYIGYLAGRRNWLAGRELSLADFAAAAEISCIDYLGEVPWEADEAAKAWYARVKSRPSFRSLLSDTLRGVPASTHYADLDF
jgi:glutathione S-transferase